ncbi:ABC transporter permease [Halolamina sp.]|jgi:ABC-type spermidine/putrescine transport system permease subunit II|uniref:ABC transporter permease n=1 Tax=Halolamina sp. TaxID=1940283 RepID=UPI000223BF99|nr:ABC-type transporter, integral membrane subunit [halophilic archaeon DL31]
MTDGRLTRLGYVPFALIVYAVLLVPVIMVILTSFTTATAPTVPTEGVSLEWYSKLLNSSQIVDALVVSTIVAVTSAVLSGIIGTVTAFGFVRAEFPYKETFSTLLLLPLMISPVITGLAIVQYAGKIGLTGNFTPLILGHVVLTLPYVFLIIRARLVTFDQTLEQASWTMGANKLETVLNVTLPIVAPSVLTGILIAFVVSFGEFTATQFLISPGTTTVPVIIYTELRTGLEPTISALAAVLAVIMLVAALLGERFGEDN